MPGTTNNHGLPYPVDSDPLRDGNDVMQQLAEALDAKLPNLPALSFSAAAGWTVDSQACMRVVPGWLTFWQVTVTRTGANIAAQTDGNFANVDVCTLNTVSERPTRRQYLDGERDGAATFKALLETTGVVSLTHQQGANIAIPTGAPVTLTGVVCLK